MSATLRRLKQAYSDIQDCTFAGKATTEEFAECLTALDKLIDREKRKPAIKVTQLADELLKIVAMLTSERRFDALASRLMDISKLVKESGVCDDRESESPF